MLIVCNRAACSPSFPWKLAGPIFPLHNPRASPHISHIHEDPCHRIDLNLHPHHEAPRRNRYFSAKASLLDDSSSQKSETSSAILWFKKDLRVDDHPGLRSASANFESVLPVYIFDPYVLRGWDTRLLEALIEAVTDLKLTLQGLGSDLIIRSGNIKHELSTLAKEVHASVIITEEEVEHEWMKAMYFLEEDGSESDSHCELKRWRAPLYQVEREIPSCYKEFRSMRCPPEKPLEAPKVLPKLPNVLDKGCIPSISEITDNIRFSLETNIWLKDIQTQSIESMLKNEKELKQDALLPRGTESRGGILQGFNSWRNRYILASPYEALEKRREELAMDSKDKDDIKNSGAGTITAMANLDAYLRFLEPTWRNDWKKVHETVMDAESRGPRGSSFRSLFGYSLILGTISRRRVYHEAFEYEKVRNGGLSSPFGFSTFTATAAVQEVKSAEWYRMLATATKLHRDGSKGWDIRIWSWRGFLIQYSTMGQQGSPVLFVHGFGASWEHYRDNIKSLAEGNRVWALSLLGFGRSEKPDVVYTQDLWAELIRDFIVEVIGEPVVLVGNSIGGYMVSMVSGIWPQIVKSLILLNTAGVIVPDYSSSSYVEPKKRNGITQAASQLSLIYLRSITSKLLKNYYPMNPSRVDDYLTGEIIRASYDPGAAIVIEGVFCISKPFPINWFTDRYKAKIYVIQGMKDPLNNNTAKVKLFKAYCHNMTIELVNAGHCPHDEIPEEINKLITMWLKQPLSQDAQSSLLQAAAQDMKS